MKLLFLLLIPISVFSFSSFSLPVDESPEPQTADPVIPTEKDPFLKNSSDLTAHPPDVAEAKVVHHQDINRKILVALVVSSSLLGGILLLVSCFSIHRLKKSKECNEKRHPNSGAVKGISFGPILEKLGSLKIGGKKGSVAAIEYHMLVAATNNFDRANILGEGGLGRVYKLVAATNNFNRANILGEGGLGRVYKAHFSNHFHVAVKKLCAGGQEADQEFQNEVESLSKIRHQNVVSLLGYCIHSEARFLVYELMENGSLEFHLHGPSHASPLTWHLRMKIALDIARGLEYLHERCNPPVIHRDLKSSNILLDSNFNAKLSDFGLAIIGGISNKTDIKPSGTLGYVAPEYLLDGKLTDKSDVYAFGVILLELLMGRRPVERVSEDQCLPIVTWAMPQLTDRSKLPNVIDPALRNTMDLKHLYQVAAIAVLCVQEEPSYRPLITDVLHSFIPLVPIDLGGSLRVSPRGTSA